MLKKKQSLEQFFEKVQILDEFSYDASVFKTMCLNVSDFELTFHISSNFETKIQEGVRLWIKLFFKNNSFDENFTFEKAHFGIFLNLTNAIFCSVLFSLKERIWEKLEKNGFWFTISHAGQILNQLFHIASDFESRTLKAVRFTANFLQLVRFSMEFLTGCRIWRQLFYRTSDFESKIF